LTVTFAQAGSQRWIQIAINRRPDVLLTALRVAGAIDGLSTVTWTSPLESEDCCEYRDARALAKAGIESLPVRPLRDFWPARGPVWDAIGTTSDGTAVFVEAKAHIPEMASPPTRATPKSYDLISRSLEEARRWYAPKATAEWSGTFYQYANRLAHHYLLDEVNKVPSILVFVYFTAADDMRGPENECEWRGAVRLLHAALGLPAYLATRGVFDAFVNVKLLKDTYRRWQPRVFGASQTEVDASTTDIAEHSVTVPINAASTLAVPGMGCWFLD
jgi:hypothetical protein